MQQARFNLSPSLIEFINSYRRYGFKNKSTMIQTALLNFQKEMETKALEQSADLYADCYQEDEELKQLTQMAITD